MTPTPETAPETTTEVVEYRVIGWNGGTLEVADEELTLDVARAQAEICREDGWTHVRVEAVSITTVTTRSGWSPVPDDTGETQ